MSNRYYCYGKSVSPSVKARKEISLTAIDSNQDILIEICTIHLGGKEEYQHIVLTEKEQDDLIAGILERRGLSLARMLPTGNPPISATGNEQSAIHSAE